MLKIRRSQDRGHSVHGWLDSYHTFSFAEYYDENFMGFRSLRVINEDRVAPGQGFGTHPHKDMEIISYVIKGSLEHKDSMGQNGSVIFPGDVQVMSAGTGVKHSEYNHSNENEVHFLQIWIVPDSKNLKPSYSQKNFLEDQKKDKLCLIASGSPRNGAIKIHQDVDLYSAILSDRGRVEFSVGAGRSVWVQVVSGEIEINGVHLAQGDGAALSDENKLEFLSKSSGEMLLFDLA